VEATNKKKFKNYSQAECFQKFNRESDKWNAIISVVLVPIWACFLIIFMGSFGGDVLNIIYFALQPFDKVFGMLISDGFLFNINGIMLHTHNKGFKYRSFIKNSFIIGLFMNTAMMVAQVCMIYLFVARILTTTYKSDNSSYYPKVVGDIVVIFFFLFDFSSNVCKTWASWFLIGIAHLLANDLKINLQRKLQPEELRAFKSLLGDDKNLGANLPISKCILEFKKIGQAESQEVMTKEE